MIGQNVQNNKYPTEQLYRQMVHTKVGIINKNVFKVRKILVWKPCKKEFTTSEISMVFKETQKNVSHTVYIRFLIGVKVKVLDCRNKRNG